MLMRGLSTVRAVGLTALYDAIHRSLDHVGKGAYPRRVLVVISDGGDNASTFTLDRTLQRVGQSDVVIYAMGLFDDQTDERERNPGVLKQLASVTGGESFFPDTTRKATATLERIAEDVRRVYTIGYVPTNTARDGKVRKIRVALNADRRRNGRCVRERVTPRRGTRPTRSCPMALRPAASRSPRRPLERAIRPPLTASPQPTDTWPTAARNRLASAFAVDVTPFTSSSIALTRAFAGATCRSSMPWMTCLMRR